ncbi:hypothetical protein NFI95_15435 [Acetobacteraceae bacterium KSS8]|uniref:Uncharacterized protein n=1 Tax=Endosaccharibacter trunci TaxID=2812733 RepID=A0ABT1WAC4_9PROT|nr:hypothetical protein [Acetobacteraceae bacterium KSS8]
MTPAETLARRLHADQVDLTGGTVDSDGKTVWVHASDGSCVGRFSRFGIDLHTTITEQMNGASECLDCTHEKPGLVEWRRFQRGTLDHYGIMVADDHMPRFLASNAPARKVLERALRERWG